MSERKFVFILSTVRSGSTLLKALLSKGGNVSHIPEVNFFHDDNLDNLKSRAISQTDKDIIVCKIPKWFNSYDYPRFNLNGNKSIIIFRCCYDVIHSIRKMLEDNPEPKFQNISDDELIDYWCETYEQLLDGTNALSRDNTHIVNYNDLLNYPKIITKQLFEFIESDLTEGVDTYEKSGSVKWEWGHDDGSEKIRSCKVLPGRSYPKNQDLMDKINSSERYQTLLHRLFLHTYGHKVYNHKDRPNCYFDPILGKKVGLRYALNQPRKDGISGFMRVKNEQDFIGPVIESVIDSLDELVIVHNDCNDNTPVIIETYKNKYPDKIKVFEYKPKVFPQGSKEHKELKSDSPHSLVNYYNFALVKTTYKIAVKIDGDDLFIKKLFYEATQKIRDNKYSDKFAMFYGINLWDSKGNIFVNSNRPLMGIGDRGFFRVSSDTIHIKVKDFELFRHPYDCYELGVLFFHMKGMKVDRGMGNYLFSEDTKYHKRIKYFYSDPKLITWDKFVKQNRIVKSIPTPTINNIPILNRHIHYGNIFIPNYNAIYIPIPKVACSSIKEYLYRIIEPKVGLMKGRSEHDVHARLFPCLHPSKLYKNNGIFTFSFVRNSWDKVVSCYMDKVARNPKENTQWFTNGVYKPFMIYGDKFWKGMTFEDFVKSICSIPDHEADPHFRSQFTFLLDYKGDMIPDFIGRFESLDSDFVKIIKQMDCNEIPLVKRNVTKREVYREFYSEETRQLVRERYVKDIELFGFKY